MRKILFVLYAILLVLALSSAIQACDPLIDPDCGSDPTDPPCIGCTAPTCGNGIINSGEQCERPSTGNNVYCLQSNHQCSGKLYGSRDSYGNCNSACGCSYDSFNYVCSVGNCGAECDSANACPSTECDNLDGCAGLDYYDYSDVSNSCSSGCACSRNACTAPTIIRNDARCAPKPVCSGSDSYYLTRFSPSSCTNSSGTFSSYCSGNAAYMRGCNSGSGLCVVTSGLDCTSYNMLCSGGYCSVCKSGYDWIDPYDHSKGCKEIVYECTYDSECDKLDSSYCVGDSSFHVEGKCVNRACVSGTPVLMQNCNSADRNFCVGSVVKNDNGYCSSGYCYVSTTTVRECNDNLFCNGVESCSAGSCVLGSSVNCAGSNIAGVASCFNVPDGNSKTWDYRASFTSSCNEASDSCNSGSSVVSSACSVLSCNAECDSTHSCASTRCTQYSGCIGRDYYVYSDVSNSCTGSCACTSNACSAPVVIRNDSRCGECSVNSDCDRLDSNFCTGSSVFRSEGVCISGMCASGTPALVNNCNDGLFCNGVESCSAGSCVSGSDVSCSEFNVPGIAACNNVPDGNPRTWDYRASFISSCNEAADSCTQSSSSAVISTCDKTRCGASCSAGEAETRACGFGGSQSRACTSCCLWNAWSNCTGEGECVSGAVENKPCGNCGTSSRVCSSEYQWNAWSACSDEGVCAEGSTQSEKCGFMLTGTRARECSSSCAWNSWGNCTGEGECNPGETEERGCEINSYSGIETRKCLSNFRWGVWSRCTIPSEKIDINMLRIINEDCVMPGEEIIAALSIGYYSYEEGDITITAVIPELGLRERIGPISTDDAETLSQLLVMEIPQGTPEGTYDVRFTINDDFRRVKYREITVKNECGVCPAYCRA
jgi:hypothetical protein